MSGEKLVVIGGTAAGLSAASRARRLQPELAIRVFERSGFVSYGSCGLPYYISGLIKKPDELISLTVDKLQETRRIEALTHHEVTRIHRTAQELSVTNLLTGESFLEPYDKLVIATGAVPVVPDLEGLDAEHVYQLRTVEDGIAIRKAVDAGIRRAVIIGGGYIGLEVAEQLCERGIAVSIMEAASRLLPFLTEEDSLRVKETLNTRGIAVRLDAKVKQVAVRKGRAVGVVLEDGTETRADLVIVAVGIRPNTQLAKDCGLALGLRDTILVDESLQTSDPLIWAAGDCIAVNHVLTGKPIYAPLGTTANKTGRVAGNNLAGGRDTFAGILGSMATKIFNLTIAATGFSVEQAEQAGYAAASESINKSDRAGYYPGAERNYLTLVFEKGSGRLLGAQGLGGASVAGRINTLAVAITAGLTVEQLNRMDFVYAPPLAPVYDPLLIAANQALKKVKD